MDKEGQTLVEPLYYHILVYQDRDADLWFSLALQHCGGLPQNASQHGTVTGSCQTQVSQDNNVAQWRAPAKRFTTWATLDNTVALQQAPATTIWVTQDNTVMSWQAPAELLAAWVTQENTLAL